MEKGDCSCRHGDEQCCKAWLCAAIKGAMMQPIPKAQCSTVRTLQPMPKAQFKRLVAGRLGIRKGTLPCERISLLKCPRGSVGSCLRRHRLSQAATLLRVKRLKKIVSSCLSQAKVSLRKYNAALVLQDIALQMEAEVMPDYKVIEGLYKSAHELFAFYNQKH